MRGIKADLDRLLDKLLEQIRDLTLGTLEDVRKAANDLLGTFEAECKILQTMEATVVGSVGRSSAAR